MSRNVFSTLFAQRDFRQITIFAAADPVHRRDWYGESCVGLARQTGYIYKHDPALLLESSRLLEPGGLWSVIR